MAVLKRPFLRNSPIINYDKALGTNDKEPRVVWPLLLGHYSQQAARLNSFPHVALNTLLNCLVYEVKSPKKLPYKKSLSLSLYVELKQLFPKRSVWTPQTRPCCGSFLSFVYGSVGVPILL